MHHTGVDSRLYQVKHGKKSGGVAQGGGDRGRGVPPLWFMGFCVTISVKVSCRYLGRIAVIRCACPLPDKEGYKQTSNSGDPNFDRLGCDVFSPWRRFADASNIRPSPR